MIRFLTRLLAACAILAGAAHAQISYTGGVYSQNFDTLPGTTNNQTGQAWTNNSTLAGWYSSHAAFGVTDGTIGGTAATFDSTSVAANIGMFSFGTAASTDRALGSRATSTGSNDPVLYGVRLVNNTTQTLTKFTVIYTGEQWFKSSAATAHTLLFDYQLGATSISTGTWTNVSAGLFTAPIATGTTPTALNGNTAANRTVKLVAVSGLSWAPGQELWVRFRDANESGNEQGLAVDDFSFLADNESGLFFNGTTSYVTMGFGTASATAFGASSFTIECRVLKTGAGTTASTGTGGVVAQPLIAKGVGEAENTTQDANYFLGIDANGKLCADFEQKNATNNGTAYAAGQNFPVTGSTTLQNGVWYHVAATYNAVTATWKLYVNGVEETGVTMPITPFVGVVPRDDSIQGLGLGTTLNSTGARSGFFQGVIDEARIWNVARTGAQILANKDSEIVSGQTGMLARFGLDEATGTTAGGTKADGSATTAGTLSGTTLPQWVNAKSFAPNASPSVTLTAPTGSFSGTAPATVSFAATASDSDGSIVKVEFFQGATKVGEDTTSPYTFDWTGVPAGTYSLTAVAIDNGGASTTSTPAVSITVSPNPNQPPVVTLSSPANNATGIGSAVNLNASIADPEGDAQTVTFYGRQTTPAAAGADFSLIAIPDTQFYSENANHNGGATVAFYNAQTQWIVDNRATRNIAFVSHMGDIVQNGDLLEAEWLNADGAMRKIENQSTTLRAFGIPWGGAPGNHDQSPNADASGTTTFFNQYFGSSRFAGRNYYGGHFGTKNNNNYELFSASGLDFIVLHLEYDTRSQASYQAVLDWANALLQAYPNRRAIVTSHYTVNTGNPASFSTQGSNIYNALKANPNLFLMLGGHVNGEGRRSDFNAATGKTVYSILQDYQDITNGGNGFLRIYTFSPASGTINVESYSPTLGRAVNASDSVPSWTTAYTLPYVMQSAVTDWIPLGTVNVPANGTTATLAWTGLEAGKDYEWYAVSNDGVSTASSSARRFSTTAPVAPTVTLTSPTDGSSVPSPATLQLTATAGDADGTIARVEFYQGGTKLGEDTTAPYEFTWTNVPPGNYALTAVAVDNSNLATLSTAVNVTVTNAPPLVAITSPADDATYDAPATFTITASASDPDGTVAKVEFFNGATKLGEDLTAPFTFNVANAYTGLYFLSAKATDNFGATTTSGVIEVFVTNTDNVPPTVAISAPVSGADFSAGATVTITATASDTDGTIAKVQFYSGATLLGEDTTAPFSFAWATPAITGSYSLTAVATDNDGGTATSAAVPITLSPPPPFSYTQNFDGMGTGTAAPAGWSFYGALGGSNSTWTDATGIPANAVGGGTLNATLTAATTFTTSSNTAGFNFALPASTIDRALGTSPTSGQGVVLQLSLSNTTGAPISAVRVGYDTRRFAAGSATNELPGYWLFYSLNGGTTWTNATALNPTITTVPNTTGVTTQPLTSVTLSSAWAAGATILFRWVDDNASQSSPDQVQGLDNVTIATAIGAVPTVALTAPANGATFVAPVTVSFAATAGDSDGTITKVEFYQGLTKVGEDTTEPYTFDWTGVAAGTYALTAIATDNDGNTASSAPVTITVNPAPGSGTLTRGPYLQKAAPTQMTVRWRSSQSVAGRVRYGTDSANLNQTVDESSATTEHVVPLTGLASNTTYFYSVGSAFDTIASGATFTFTTPPVAGTVINTRIWALGDAGTANSNQTAVRDAFYTWTGSRTPNMVLQLGDNAYNSGLDTEFQAAVFDMYPTMLRKTPFWSCLGNHETAQATAFVDTYPYFNIYTFPTAGECGGVASGTEHYYSWDYANIHFISLDSMTASRATNGAMATWLTNDLASTTQTWIICIFHHPPYTKGSHNSDTETELIEMRTNILPILEAGGVDLVLNGHSHCYERSYLLDGHYGLSATLTSAMKLDAGNGRPAGTGAYIKPLTGPRDHFGAVYSVAGSAGQTSGGSLNHPAHFISLNNLGSLVLDVNGTRLDATFVKSDGTTPDTFTIIQQGAADSDGDGISDEYEIAHGMNRHDPSDAALDSDGDGLTNLQEFRAGTDSNNAADKPRVASLALQTDGSILLQIPTTAGKNYRVEANNAFPTGTWAIVGDNIAGTGSLVPVPDSGAIGIPNRIYRLTVLP